MLVTASVIPASSIGGHRCLRARDGRVVAFVKDAGATPIVVLWLVPLFLDFAFYRGFYPAP